MSETRFTPGPWKTQPAKWLSGEDCIEVQYGEAGELVCTIESAAQAPDANLIAAAPDLYAALEALEAAVTGGVFLVRLNTMDAARAALRKARGEETT